jgi:uncharacterized protein
MELPLFPLHAVLFPGRPLPLHIFEPRYRQMLAECMDGDRRFGVVAIRAGSETGDADIFDVGTVAEIQDVRELSDGRFDIATRGVERFRIVELLEGTPYLRGRVDRLTDLPPENGHATAEELRGLLRPYLACLGAPPELLDRLPQEPERLACLAATAMHVDLREQQAILELDAMDDRLAEALRLLRRETCLIRHLGTVGSLRPPGPGGAQLN